MGKLVLKLLLLCCSVAQSLQSDIINRGTLFPCMFYLPKPQRYFYLYPMQLDQDSTVFAEEYSFTMNVCERVKIPQSRSISPPSYGSMYFTETASNSTFVTSFHDGFMNSTRWSVDQIEAGAGGAEGWIGVEINGTNYWDGNGKLLNSTIRIRCDASVAGFAYVNTVKVEKTEERLVITMSSEHGCGFELSDMLKVDEWIFKVYYLVAGLLLVVIGYKILTLTLVVSCFFIGLSISIISVFEGSNPNNWGTTAKVSYLIFSVSMGFILAHSSFYFPHGALYGCSLFLGLSLAELVCKRFDVQERLFVGYLALMFFTPAGLIYFFHRNYQNCTYIFTSLLGSAHLLLFVDHVNHWKIFNSFVDLLDLHKYVEYKSLILITAVILIVGWNCQYYFFSKNKQSEIDSRHSARMRDYIDEHQTVE